MDIVLALNNARTNYILFYIETRLQFSKLRDANTRGLGQRAVLFPAKIDMTPFFLSFYNRVYYRRRYNETITEPCLWTLAKREHDQKLSVRLCKKL